MEDSIGAPPLVEKPIQQPEISALEKSMQAAGLVNVQELDSTILVDLKYSSTDNFVGADVYGDLENAYLQKETTDKLLKAQQLLKAENPDFTLLIYDAARPRSVQQILWDTVQVPLKQKPIYVADPKIGSIHNYGSAIDLTIAKNTGEALDMGTKYDFFGPLAHPAKEKRMLAESQLTQTQLDNRLLLRTIMTEAGFYPITSEWWHFNAFSRKEAKRRYEIIE